jgi:tetratricopeptide (TPR) repeat protein
MLGIIDGADEWAIKSYQKATELDPNGPDVFTELGRVYLVESDILSQQEKQKESSENLKLAQENFEKAIALKSDYASAHYQIAMIYVRQGKIQEAISKLEETQQISPYDTGVAFQIGVLHYNSSQWTRAKTQFERAVLIDPNYSNARYFLGLIYDRQGNKNEAITQFENILQLNPDNQDVQKILANLRAGKSALEGVMPGQPPVEEQSSEKLKK